MYGMKRTTVYLPEDLKTELERLARSSGESEAELIREGVRHVVVARRAYPKPDFPLFSGGELKAAKDEEMLAGDPKRGIPSFGEW